MSTAPIWAYELEPKEEVPACNLCGPTLPPYILARSDRYGLPVTSLQCPRCGLVWISPRMTQEGYRRFYEHGTYRYLVGTLMGREQTLESVESDQRRYAEVISEVVPPANGPVLDVGGSTGIVGKAFGDNVTVLDPSAKEIRRASGCEVLLKSVEDWDPRARRWDLILCCRTLDHVLDPKEAMKKFRRALGPGGKLWVDVVQWQVVASMGGSVERAMKVDHPYAFMEGALLYLMKATGFSPLRRLPLGRSVGYLCG